MIYHTRIQSTVFFFLFFSLGAGLCFSDIGTQAILRNQGELFLHCVRVLLPACSLYLLYVQATSSIRVDDQGIAQVRAFYRKTWRVLRFIAWENVLKVRYGNNKRRRMIFVIPKNTISGSSFMALIGMPTGGFDPKPILQHMLERGVSIQPEILSDYGLTQKEI